VLPQRLGTTGTNALFVAKRLVKHDVLGAGFDLDAAVHGQDADQAGIDFLAVNHELFGASSPEPGQALAAGVGVFWAWLNDTTPHKSAATSARAPRAGLGIVWKVRHSICKMVSKGVKVLTF
jgi:hypothetical protein